MRSLLDHQQRIRSYLDHHPRNRSFLDWRKYLRKSPCIAAGTENYYYRSLVVVVAAGSYRSLVATETASTFGAAAESYRSLVAETESSGTCAFVHLLVASCCCYCSS
jgi:hypothetical protein